MTGASLTRSKNPRHAPAVKKRNRVESTQKLMDAALEVFSESGFDGATTKAISRRAGLKESLIQRYFKSKAGLLTALIKKYAEMKFIVPYPAGKTVEDEIYNHLNAQYDSDTKNSSFVRVAFHSVLGNPALMKELEGKYRNPGNLVSRLKYFQNKGQIGRDVDIQYLAQIIGSQNFITGILESAFLGIKDAEIHRRQFKIFAHYIVRGIS